MTKEQIRQSVDAFLENSEYCKVESERRKHAALLNKLCDDYQEELSLTDNIRIRINSDSKTTFSGFKTRIRHWLEFADLENEVNLRKIKFEFSYFTFTNLYTKLTQTPTAEWNKIDLYYFTLAKLYAYLRWIGVPSDKVFDIIKGDYNSETRILLVSGKEYDLKINLYDECSESVHQEIMNNLNSITMIKNVDTNVVEYVYGTNYKYDEYKPMFTSISGENCKKLQSNIRIVLQDLVYSDNLIAKNGLFDRISKVTGNELISSVKFQDIITRPEISNTFRFSDELLQEYRSWQTKVK